ncbi:MAG TPA: tRNA epoxyqueuosine(34) reductase QueG [Bryobacteraceae bacterium]|nr:tRNA epoxyqueuosine(34) reductase QueG [Bryobacteraceae bacterium]
MTTQQVRHICREAGFELAGVAPAEPSADAGRYRDWIERGCAGEMTYLTDRRAGLRNDPRLLLPSARSVICVGKLYNRPEPPSPISRYAWGEDYHDVLRLGLNVVAQRLGDHEYKICVDTAPLLERSYAREAGLGWIGKNTCLINQEQGSWFFLGEILTSLEIAPGTPPPDRCGTCTRCIDACPTHAIADRGYELDARACISYFTIELRSIAPEVHRPGIGQHVFGCDICQDVCPWNQDAPFTAEAAFAPNRPALVLEEMAELTEDEFRAKFRSTPVWRAKYGGFLRNVAIAMGNSGEARFRTVLEKMAVHENPFVAEAASWSRKRL